MKTLFSFLLLLPLITFGQVSGFKQTGAGTGAPPAGFTDPGAGFGDPGFGPGFPGGGFGDPYGQRPPRRLNLPDLSEESSAQCSFNVTTTPNAAAAESAINQIIEQCTPRTNPPTPSPMAGIAQAFGDAARDPLSCANYQSTFDRMFRRAMEHPEFVTGELSMCVSSKDGVFETDENCLFRTVAQQKEARRLACEDSERQREMNAQSMAIQAGVQELDTILTGIINDNSATCPDVDEGGKARILQTIVSTASQILSIPFAGTGLDLGIGLLANGLSRLFSSQERGLERIRNRMLNIENFSNLACLQENLQKEVSQCSYANARFENTRAEETLANLEGNICRSTFGSISPNLETFLSSITQIKQNAEGQSACPDPRTCVQSLIRNLSEVDQSGSSLADLILESAAENTTKLQARLASLNELNDMNSRERADLLSRLAESGDPVFQQISSQRELNAQNNLINQIKVSTEESLATVQASSGFVNEICRGNCQEALGRSGRNEILNNPQRISAIVAAINSTSQDPIAAINTSLMLRTDIGLHGDSSSSLALFARQFTMSQRIRNQHQFIASLRERMTPRSDAVADQGRRKSIELINALSTSLTSGRNSLVRQQLNHLDRTVRRLNTTPRDCAGDRASSANCQSSRLSMFESDVKSLFMICQQLHSLGPIGGGQSTPQAEECQRFNCAFQQFPTEASAPGATLDFNNVDHNNFVCSNFNKKNQRLQLIRDNFVSTGQVCPAAN